jgi:hypothetical protein
MSSFLTHYSSSFSPALQVANVVLSHTLQFFLLTSIAGSKCRPFSHTTDLPSHQNCRKRMSSFLTHYSSSFSPALQVANVFLSHTLQFFAPALQVANVFLSHTLQFFLPALQVANVVLSHTLQFFLLTSIAGSKCRPFSNTTDLLSHQHCR